MALKILEIIIKVITTCIMLFIAVISFMIYAAFARVLRFPNDLHLYSVQLISIVIGITSCYFAIIPYFFDSYIDFTRIFLRLHNVCVLWVLYFQLMAAHKSASLAAYTTDTYQEHYETDDCYGEDEINKLKDAVKRTEMNLLTIPILNGILTLIFIWKVIKFILFYYLELDV